MCIGVKPIKAVWICFFMAVQVRYEYYLYQAYLLVTIKWLASVAAPIKILLSLIPKLLLSMKTNVSLGVSPRSVINRVSRCRYWPCYLGCWLRRGKEPTDRVRCFSAFSSNSQRSMEAQADVQRGLRQSCCTVNCLSAWLDSCLFNLDTARWAQIVPRLSPGLYAPYQSAKNTRALWWEIDSTTGK